MIRKLQSATALFALLLTLMVYTSPVIADERMAKDGDMVSIHYTGKLEDSTVFDSSENMDPLEFQLGTEQIIPGFNEGIRGMKVGESKTISILPKDAYGPYNDKLVFEVPTKNLPAGVQAGSLLRDPQGGKVLVKEVNGDTSVLDANHFLAGKTLIFDLKLVSIK